MKEEKKPAWVYALLVVAFCMVFASASQAWAGSHGKDPTKETVLIDKKSLADMVIIFEIEPAKSMWMPMAHGGMWMEMKPGADEKYHFEVKPEDPNSKTRISYAKVTMELVNKNTGKKIAGELHPMWGGSGLHYALNGPMAGDGTYLATIVVEPPTFARSPKEKDWWMKPVKAEFEFRFEAGKVVK